MESNVSVFRVKPDKVEKLKDWFEEVNQREEEVLETMRGENTRKETVVLEEINEQYYLFYYMQAENFEKAMETFFNSDKPIDKKHREVLEECLGEEVKSEILADFDNCN